MLATKFDFSFRTENGSLVLIDPHDGRITMEITIGNFYSYQIWFYLILQAIWPLGYDDQALQSQKWGWFFWLYVICIYLVLTRWGSDSDHSALVWFLYLNRCSYRTNNLWMSQCVSYWMLLVKDFSLKRWESYPKFSFNWSIRYWFLGFGLWSKPLATYKLSIIQFTIVRLLSRARKLPDHYFSDKSASFSRLVSVSYFGR